MSKINDSHRIGVAFAAVAMEAGAVTESAASLKAMQQVFTTHPELLAALSETALPIETRQNALRELKGLHPLVANLLMILIEQDALRDLSDVSAAAFGQWAELKAYHEVTVVSATKMSTADHKALSEMLHSMLGGEIELTEKTDPSLLAGVVIEQNGVRMDSSVRGRLNRLTHHLYGT